MPAPKPNRSELPSRTPGGDRAADSHPVRLLLILGGLAALGPASMDMYVPGLPALTRDFGIAASTGQLTLTAFLIGMGVGQLAIGPLSDVFGRRSPLLAGIGAYVAASILCAAAPSISILVAERFLQGTASAAGAVVTRAIVRDLYSGAAAARYFSRLVLVIGLAPILAPGVGGVLLGVTSWRGIFLALGALAAVLLVASALWLPETLPPERRHSGGLRQTMHSFDALLRHRVFVGYTLVVGCAAACFLAYVSASSFVLQQGYGLSAQLSGALLAAGGLAVVASSQLNARLIGPIAPRRLLCAGLLGVVVSGICLLAVAAWNLGIVPLLATLLLLTFTWGFIASNAIALALTDHPRIAGAASALIGLFQYTAGAVVAPLVGLGNEASPVPMGVAMAVFATLGLLFVRALTRSHARTIGAESAEPA